MLNVNNNFWGVFTAWAYASMDEITAVKRGKRQTLQKRRRGVIPAGAAPSYWRQIYTIVEELWNDLPEADKNTWRYGWKKYGNTGRDEFGHWNMNLVGRWSKLLRTRPAVQSTWKRHTDYPGSEAVASRYICGLPGTWQPWSGWPDYVEGQRRIVNASGPTIAAAYAAAVALLPGQPWENWGYQIAGNFSFAHQYAPGSIMATIVQRWSRIKLGGLAGYAWRDQYFRFFTGSPYGGCTDRPWLFDGQQYGAGWYTVDWPNIRALSVAQVVTPRWDDVTGWDPPPPPTQLDQDTGWNIRYLLYGAGVRR